MFSAKGGNREYVRKFVDDRATDKPTSASASLPTQLPTQEKKSHSVAIAAGDSPLPCAFSTGASGVALVIL